MPCRHGVSYGAGGEDRTRPPALLCILVLLALAAGPLLALRSSHAAHAPPNRLAGTVVWPSGARPAPAFALRDQAVVTVSERLLRGQIWAITFLDSRCRQACPVAARELARVQHMLDWHHPLVVVIVSVLPRYDTPARVRTFARRAGL